MENFWGAIELARWQETPCIKGVVATEDDVKAGRAVYFIPTGSEPAKMALPVCVIQKEEDSDNLIPAIAIQAEEMDGDVFVGVRYLKEGNGVLKLTELTILPGPNDLFSP